MKRGIVRLSLMIIILFISFSLIGCAVGIREPYPTYYGPDYDYSYDGLYPYAPRYEHPGHREHEEQRNHEHEEHGDHEREQNKR